MGRFIAVCIVAGILFGILDGGIKANPYAQKLFSAYKPIAKESVNIPAGMAIDLLHGFAMGVLFVSIYKSLPGSTGIMKGTSFALMLWFFRVFMNTASTWMMFTIPLRTLLYVAVAGLMEMLILGVLYGALLKPFKRNLSTDG